MIAAQRSWVCLGTSPVKRNDREDDAAPCGLTRPPATSSLSCTSSLVSPRAKPCRHCPRTWKREAIQGHCRRYETFRTELLSQERAYHVQHATRTLHGAGTAARGSPWVLERVVISSARKYD